MSLRLAYVTSHPIQYQAALFRTLAATPDVDFKAFFATDWGLENQFDPGFGRHITWDVPLLAGYAHEFVPNLAPKPTVSRFTGLVNPSIGAALRRWRVDVVIVHGYMHATTWLAMAQCRAAGIPVLIRGESNLLPARRPVVRAAKQLAAMALRQLVAGAVAIGSHNAAYWRSYGVRRQSYLPRTLLGLDNAFFRGHAEAAHARAAQWRREFGLTASTLIAGYAAKLSHVKDAKTLIEAFGRAAVPDTALVVVGDGVLRAELEALARRFPQATMKFTGFLNQTEMPSAYALSDVFVLPSIFEPWGLVINEAMNLARPVIVSDQVGCAPDLVGPDNGWVFPAGDVAALTTILREALAAGGRERLERMGAASLARIAHWGLPETAHGFVAAANAVRR